MRRRFARQRECPLTIRLTWASLRAHCDGGDTAAEEKRLIDAIEIEKGGPTFNSNRQIAILFKAKRILPIDSEVRHEHECTDRDSQPEVSP